MSTVKATHFEHPSASTAGITLAADGSVVLPQGFTGGVGSNVVQAVKTDTFSTTSTTYVDVTGLTVTITPTSSTSKVLIIADIHISQISGTRSANARLARGGSAIYVGVAEGSRTPSSASSTGNFPDAGYNATHPTLVFVDSPGSVSPQTYSVQLSVGAVSSPGTAVLNRYGNDANDGSRPRMASSITAIEVAA